MSLIILHLAAALGVTQAPPAALSMVEPGQWSLRMRDRNALLPPLCIGDARKLLQLRHRAAACSQYIIKNNPKDAAVHYSCAAAGEGQTTLRVESGQLLQIDTQGFADNAPFDWSLEGRRTGPCRP